MKPDGMFLNLPPPGATIVPLGIPASRGFFQRIGCRPSSVVEHSLGKGEVEGSSPLGGFR